MVITPATPLSTVVSRCGCGAVYTLEAWRRLKLVGIQELPGEDIALEMRDCRCKSTRAIEVPAKESVK